jgi:general secretion pathway protein B
MSYILDALKKLENEKSKKMRADGSLNIAGSLFKETPQRTRKRHTWKIAFGVIAASLITFATTWIMLQDDNKKVASKAPAVVQPTVQPVQAVLPPAQPQIPMPTASPAAIAPPALSPATELSPVKTDKSDAQLQQQPAPVASPAQPVHSQTVKSATAKNVSRIKPVKSKKHNKPASPPVAKHSAPQNLTPPPAGISVSGIAWQDERRARIAVVNGFVIREGSVVAGAKITEIMKEKVRFSSGDNAFEVPLLMSISPGTAK